MIRSSITDNELTRTCALTRSLELLFSFTYTSLRKQTDRELRETTPSDGENYAPIFAFRSAPRSLSLRTTIEQELQLGSLLARLALARNSQLTSPTQRREVVYLLSSNMPTAFRSLTQHSLVYLLASAIPHLCFQGI